MGYDFAMTSLSESERDNTAEKGYDCAVGAIEMVQLIRQLEK